MRKKLRVAYSPDSDDAFNFYAWEYGKVSVDADVELDFHRAHIIELNHLAEREEFDVTLKTRLGLATGCASRATKM